MTTARQFADHECRCIDLREIDDAKARNACELAANLQRVMIAILKLGPVRVSKRALDDVDHNDEILTVVDTGTDEYVISTRRRSAGESTT